MPLLARLGLAALAGVATGVSFEPLGLVFLLPLAVGALPLLCRGVTARRGLLVGWVFGAAFMLTLLPWLQVIGGAAWIALSLVEGLFYALLGLGTVAALRLPGWPVWTAALWVLVEALRGALPFGGFPWGRLAFATVDTPVQDLFAYVGPAGVTFAVALLGGAIAWAVLEVRRAPVRAVVAVTAAGALVSLAAVFPWQQPPTDRSARIAAVQGNVPGVGLDAFAERRAVLDNHVNATLDYAAEVAAGRRPAPDLVVWPENSSDIDPYADVTAAAAVSGAARAIHAPLLMGAVVGDRAHSGWHNRALVWSADGQPGAYYDKTHPVPFGEYIPFRRFLAPRVPALDQIPSDMIPGTRPGVLEVGPARLGVVMCFEVAYDGLVRSLVDGGAQVVVVPTNNATYTGTGQVEQQFAISRLRAIETGRYVVVAATNGISGFVAPDGHVVDRAEPRTRAVLVHAVRLGTGRTPAVRWGATIERGLGLLGAVSVSVGIAMNYRRRRLA